MKKNLVLLAIVLLSGLLVGFALDRTLLAGTVRAAGEIYPVISSATSPQPAAAAQPSAVRPAVIAAVGLVCALFGMMAVFPLWIGDPAQPWREAMREEG